MPSPFTPQIRCFFIVALSTLFITLIFLLFLLLRGHAKIIINTQQQQKMNDNFNVKNENNHNNNKIEDNSNNQNSNHHPIDWNSYHYTDTPSSGHREVRHEEIFVNDYDERHPQQARLKKKQREELKMMNTAGANRKIIKTEEKIQTMPFENSTFKILL